MKKLTFNLPDLDLSKDEFLFCGNGKRKATATDIIAISDNLILVSSLLGRKLYLIDISESFNIINEIDCEGYVDLMDYKDGIIATSNASYKGLKGSVSLFKIIDNKITSLKTITFEKDNRLHGCLFIDKENLIIGSNDEYNPGIYFLNINEEKLYSFIPFKLRIKDLCFYKNKLLIVGSETSPGGVKTKVITSILYRYDYKTMELIDSIIFNGQCDAICVNEDIAFITLQCEHSIIKINLNNKLENLEEIKGFNFPHGCDFKNQKLFVTNYGNNSIDIIKQ